MRNDWILDMMLLKAGKQEVVDQMVFFELILLEFEGVYLQRRQD
jgi:hypothetical protein